MVSASIVESASDIKTTPLLKWPGGKRAILRGLLPLVPSSFHTYFEPFVGGGALFFAIKPSKALLSDANPEHINRWAAQRSCQSIRDT